MRKSYFTFFLFFGIFLKAQTPANDPTWQLVFSDDFNSAFSYDVNSNLLLNFWDIEDHTDNYDYKVKNECLSLKKNVAIAGGVLTITTRKESYVCTGAYAPSQNPILPKPWWFCNQPYYQYTSGGIHSKNNNFHFGYYEARIKMDFSNGYWPSFWLLGYDGSPLYSEIDIFEMVGSQASTLGFKDGNSKKKDGSNQIYGPLMSMFDMTSNVHCVGDPDLSQNDGFEYPNVSYVADYRQWHTYGFEWWPNRMIWYVDGVMVRSIKTPIGFDQTIPMQVILAAGVVKKIEETSIGTHKDPCKMDIDYFKYYQLSGNCSPGVTQACYIFPNHDDHSKQYYDLGDFCYNTVPAGKNYIFRGRDFVQLKGEFNVPLGSEALFDAEAFCAPTAINTGDCGIVLNPCNYNFYAYDNNPKQVIEFCGPGCSAIVQQSDNVKLHAKEYIKLSEGFSVPLNSEIEIKIVNCP